MKYFVNTTIYVNKVFTMFNSLVKGLVIAVTLTGLVFNAAKAQTVVITAPATGSTYTIGNTITVTGTASVPGIYFITSVVVTVSTASATATGTTSYSASVSTTGLSPGTYTLTVTSNYSFLATGLFAGTKTATISVTLIPAAPIISYTTPQVYTAGTAITTLTPTNTGGAVGTFAFGTATALTGATLNNPRGVGIDASGNVYVTNSGNNTISKYNSSGTYVSTFGSGATMSFPKDIVFDSSGNAYVLNLGASANTGSVFKYNSSGVYQSTILSGLNYALGLTIDASDNIYVADQGAVTVKKYSTSGSLLLSLPTTNFSTPLGVAVDGSGNIYVANNGTGNVTKYNSAGTFISTFLTGYTSLQTIAIDGAGNIYVGDNAATNTVYVYNQSGTLLTSKAVTDPQGIAVDTKGNMYISSYFSNQMNKYAPTGGYFLDKALPAGLSFNSSTGSISGTPTATQAATVYTVTAYNAGGSGNTTLTITVNPTVPTGGAGSTCSSGSASLTASASTPTGGVYTWYTVLSGGSSVGTGSPYATPALTSTTTYYVDYTLNGATSTPRTAVVATVTAGPALAAAPTSPTGNLYFSYPFTGNANDASGNSNNGTLQNSPTLTTDRYSTANSAYSFNGTSQYVSTATVVASPGPQTFSISVWFKTSSAGGKLIGFGSLQTGSSPNNDRHIYMSNSGQLYFGLFPSAYKLINTTASYADGSWHHVVATESTTNGANLYVDGALQATDATMTASQVYAGYWRVGYDNMVTWPNVPTSYYFNGSLDDVAIYNTELTAAQINVLYGAGCSSFCAGNSVSFSANTVAGATYSWSGPGSFSSTSQNPTVTNAVAGTYTLTVTSAGGCTSTINVAAPSNAITSTWTGAAGTTNPLTAGNWSQLPAFNSTSNLVIPGSLSFYPTLTANEIIYGLTIASGASLNLNGFTLSVGCNIYNNASTGGTGILYGSNTASAITWNGATAAQTFTGANTTNTTQLGNMTLNNSVAGTLTITGGPVDVYNTLTITKGNLVINNAGNGALTLKSSSSLTASVAAIPSSYTITGNVNVERFLTGGSSVSGGRWVYRNYRLMSSPVNAGLVSGKYPYTINYIAASAIVSGAISTYSSLPGNPTIYVYSEDYTPSNAGFTTGNFKGVTDMSTITSPYTLTISNNGTTKALYVGNGFMFFFRGDKINSVGTSPGKTTYPYVAPESVVFTATGNLNQGSYTVNNWQTGSGLLYTTVTGNSAIQGFNLVGNPYASTIDWEATNSGGIVATNVNSSIYVFNPVTNQYNTYSASTHVGNPVAFTGKIASGQGFFVRANNTSPSLVFNESAKSTTVINAGSGNLMMGAPAGQAVTQQLFRLRLSIDSINYDDIAIGFKSTASAKYDLTEDSEYLSGLGAAEGLASYSGDAVPKALAINFLSLPKKAPLVIKLNVTAKNSGRLTLEKTQLDSLPKIYELWLMDKYKKDSLDIRNNSTYIFDIDRNDTLSFGNNRFELVIRQNKALKIHLLDFKAAKATGGVQLTWKVENEENYTNFTVERSTDNGATFSVLGGSASNSQGVYTFMDSNPANAVNMYRVKMEDLNGTISYTKTIGISYNAATGLIASTNIAVYPNPAVGLINLNINQPRQAPLNLSGVQGVGNNPTTATTPGSYSIKIINVSGAVIRSATSAQQTWQGDVSALQPGTYILQVLNNKDKSVVGKATFVKL